MRIKGRIFLFFMTNAESKMSEVQSPREKLLFPLAIVTLFFLGFKSGGFQLVLYDIAVTYRLGNVMMGAVVTTLFLALAVGPLVFGPIADRVGKKRILMIFMPVLITGCVLAVLARSGLIFIASVFVIGAGYGVCECLFTAAVSDSDQKRAEKQINMMQAFFSIGAVTGPLVVGFLMRSVFDWRIVFIVAGLGFAALFPVLLYTHFRVKVPLMTEASQKTSARTLFSSKLFLLLLVSIVIFLGLETGTIFFADTFFAVELGASEFGGPAISLFWLATVFSRLLFSRIQADALRAIYLLYGALAIALFVLTQTSNVFMALGLYFFMGFVLGPVWGLLMAAAMKTQANQSGTAASVMMAGGSAGAMLFPVILGATADVSGFRGSMGLLAVVAVCGSLLIFRSVRKRSKHR